MDQRGACPSVLVACSFSPKWKSGVPPYDEIRAKVFVDDGMRHWTTLRADGSFGLNFGKRVGPMAKCSICSRKIGWVEPKYEDYETTVCVDCGPDWKANKQAEQLNAKLEIEKVKAEIEAIMLTTETAPNLNITKRIEIVTAECAFGMNIFKDLFAGVRDIVGGRSEAVQQTMRDSRRTALYELKREAHAVGANAVVGVDLDYVELSAAGSMVMLVASGTAVVIEDLEG